MSNLAEQKRLMTLIGGEVEFYEAGGILVKAYGIPAMKKIEQHVHDDDHVSVLVSGHAHVVVDGIDHDMNGTGFITIEAGKKHTIITETDTLWLCIHNTDRLEKHL